MKFKLIEIDFYDCKFCSIYIFITKEFFIKKQTISGCNRMPIYMDGLRTNPSASGGQEVMGGAFSLRHF